MKGRYMLRVIATVMILAAAVTGALHMAGAQGPISFPVISGNIGDRAIEIDDLDDNPTTTPNANMVEGADPTTDPDLPYIVGATYIDWDDLAPEAGTDKFVFNDGSGSTDDSFAGSSTRSCLQPAHSAPQKEDILRAYLADNGEYLYVGLVDLAPQGNSRHVILFHKNPVEFGASCAGDGQQMHLDLTSDDKLILAVFRPSADEPAARVFSVVGDPGLLYMDEAANFDDATIWTETAAVANFAVNIDDIANDALGGNVFVPAETFGEGAVALSDLGVPACGASYQVSIVTRSSGSGGGEAKDYIGGVYNFPSIAVTAVLTPSCDAEFDYWAQATNGAGDPITDATYDWNCNDGALTFSGQSGTMSSVPAASYTCVVTATSGSCSATSTQVSVDVYDPLGVAVDAVPSCDLSGNSYSAVVSGGSGSVSHAWSGTGVSFSDPSAASGTYSVSANGTYTLTDLVTDQRTDGPICTATDSDKVQLALLGATATLTDTCTLQVPFSSSVAGSLGTVSYAWTFSGDTAVTPPNSIDPSGTVDVAAPGGIYTGTLVVTDLRTDIGSPSIGTYSCTAPASDSAEAYGPISVSIAPDATGLVCPAVDTAGTDVTYTASASGGNGSYTYSWMVTGANTAPACGDSVSCLVDSAASDYCALIQVQVNVDDSFDLCDAEDSEVEDVSKVTSVTASDN